jgi:hypothetical protein
MKKATKTSPKAGKGKDEKRKNPFEMPFEDALKKALNTPLPKKSRK